MSEVDKSHQEIPVEHNLKNLSLYSFQEEQVKLNSIAEKMSFPLKIVPIDDGENSLGYLIVPESIKEQRKIISEASIHFVDYDDTLAQTSINKQECWQRLSNLGLSREIIQFCDKASRLTFRQEYGEIYEPELDMRLITYAIQHPNNDVEVLKDEIGKYLNELLSTEESFAQVLEQNKVDIRVQEIFDDTRFSVDLYPDTVDILRSLKRTKSDWCDVNLFCLTYGDSVFQLNKSLPLLKNGLVHAIFLTKSKKGPFLREVLTKNPFTDIDVSYEHDWRRLFIGYGASDYKGINAIRDGQQIILIDDDPRQVKSIDQMVDETGVSMEVRRIISSDQKRAKSPTPLGNQVKVIEISRDSNLRIEQNMEQIQAELFRDANIKSLKNKFKIWLEEYIVSNLIKKDTQLDWEQCMNLFLDEIQTDEEKERTIGRADGWVDTLKDKKWFPREVEHAALFIVYANNAIGKQVLYDTAIEQAIKLFNTEAMNVFNQKYSRIGE